MFRTADNFKEYLKAHSAAREVRHFEISTRSLFEYRSRMISIGVMVQNSVN